MTFGFCQYLPYDLFRLGLGKVYAAHTVSQILNPSTSITFLTRLLYHVFQKFFIFFASLFNKLRSWRVHVLNKCGGKSCRSGCRRCDTLALRARAPQDMHTPRRNEISKARDRAVRGAEPPADPLGVLRAFRGRTFSFSLSVALGHSVNDVLRYFTHEYALVPTAEVVVQQ